VATPARRLLSGYLSTPPLGRPGGLVLGYVVDGEVAVERSAPGRSSTGSPSGFGPPEPPVEQENAAPHEGGVGGEGRGGERCRSRPAPSRLRRPIDCGRSIAVGWPVG